MLRANYTRQKKAKFSTHTKNHSDKYIEDAFLSTPLSTLTPVLERFHGFQRLTGIVGADGET